MSKALNVYWDEKPVGQLWLDDRRNFVFRYDSAWISAQDTVPISVRLPLRAKAFEENAAKYFFSNLLPEARIREMIAKGLGISATNDFKLLEYLGGDCAGALSLLSEGHEPTKEGSYQSLSKKELEKMIEEMPRRPLLTAREGLRLSLAGAQNKLPVYVKEGAVFLPKGAYASSHILKPKIPEFPDTVENEAFCMRLAMDCGLPAPVVRTWGGKYPSLLIERYDREAAEGALRRLHQEDFCQALGYGYDQKYQSEGGPGLEDCFALLAENGSEPIIDKKYLLRWVVFNHLIGNCDAHAKNLSILITKDGIRLAPFYDLMSTVVYPSLAAKAAMKIGGENRPKWTMKRHWERFAGEAGVGVKAVLGTCIDLGQSLPGKAKTLAKVIAGEHGTNATVKKICVYVASMSKRLLENLKSEG